MKTPTCPSPPLYPSVFISLHITLYFLLFNTLTVSLQRLFVITFFCVICPSFLFISIFSIFLYKRDRWVYLGLNGWEAMMCGRFKCRMTERQLCHHQEGEKACADSIVKRRGWRDGDSGEEKERERQKQRQADGKKKR